MSTGEYHPKSNMSNKHLELLHLAQVENDDVDPLYLLSQGANPNIRDSFYHKWTPLHYAASLNKERFVLQILQDPKTKATLIDSDGFSALYWAAKKGSSASIIKALLSNGCDPNERDMHGMTALFAAVASNKKENVKCLVSHPLMNINQPNQFGGSALHHTAFATDNVEIADVLVQAGANLFLFDYEKQQPLHVAKRRNRKNLFKYFKRKMEEQEPSYICDVLMEQNESETSANSEESVSVSMGTSMSNPIPIKQLSKPKSRRPISKSPGPPRSIPQSTPKEIVSWHNQHQNKLKNLQENKLKLALEMEQSHLNKAARDLLHRQQIHFQCEHELFYSSMKHEYNKLQHQRDHYMKLGKDLINENIKLKMALKQQNNMNYIKPMANTHSKHQKQFQKWFKKEIGADFMQYYDYFVNSGFDDLRTIRYIAHEQELIGLGITKKGHRLHILDRIHRLQLNNEAVALPSNEYINTLQHNEIDCVEGSFNQT